MGCNGSLNRSPPESCLSQPISQPPASEGISDLTVDICVTSVVGEVITELQLSGRSCIGHVKALIEQRSNVSVSEQNLTYRGEILDDAKLCGELCAETRNNQAAPEGDQVRAIALVLLRDPVNAHKLEEKRMEEDAKRRKLEEKMVPERKMHEVAEHFQLYPRDVPGSWKLSSRNESFDSNTRILKADLRRRDQSWAIDQTVKVDLVLGEAPTYSNDVALNVLYVCMFVPGEAPKTEGGYANSNGTFQWCEPPSVNVWMPRQGYLNGYYETHVRILPKRYIKVKI